MTIIIDIRFSKLEQLPAKVRRNFCQSIRLARPESKAKNWQADLKNTITQSYNYASNSKSSVVLKDVNIKNKSLIVEITTTSTTYQLPCYIEIKKSLDLLCN